jgi:hypothetical protein
MNNSIDRTFVRKVRKDQKKNDFLFWQTQTPQARLEVLESIREEFNNWKYGNQQRFQRVYKIIKRA